MEHLKVCCLNSMWVYLLKKNISPFSEDTVLSKETLYLLTHCDKS